MLPLPGAITSQLDKASIVRLTIAYLRLREFAAHGDPPWNRDGRFDGKPTLKGLIHFLILISLCCLCGLGSQLNILIFHASPKTEIQFTDTAKLEIL